jgi:hypothetical protein
MRVSVSPVLLTPLYSVGSTSSSNVANVQSVLYILGSCDDDSFEARCANAGLDFCDRNTFGVQVSWALLAWFKLATDFLA